MSVETQAQDEDFSTGLGQLRRLVYLRTSPLWMLVFIFSVKCSTLACWNKHQRWSLGGIIQWRLSQKPECLLMNESQTLRWKEPSYMLCVTERWCVNLQVSDVERLLIDIGSISPSCQAPDTGQVTTVASHSLNDEHASLGSTCRLLDAVTRLTQAYKLTKLVNTERIPLKRVLYFQSVMLRHQSLIIRGHKLLKQKKEGCQGLFLNLLCLG